MFPRKRLPGVHSEEEPLSPGLPVKGILSMMAVITEEKESVMEALSKVR